MTAITGHETGRLTGQPERPPWRSQYRDHTTAYRYHDDGRVSVVCHRRMESVGWREIEVFGSTVEEAEAAWQAWLEERAESQIARSHRRAKWGLRGGWQT